MKTIVNRRFPEALGTPGASGIRHGVSPNFPVSARGNIASSLQATTGVKLPGGAGGFSRRPIYRPLGLRQRPECRKGRGPHRQRLRRSAASSAARFLRSRRFWLISGRNGPWICQWVGQEIRVLDYIEGVGQVLGDYVDELRRRHYERAIC